MKYDVFDGKTEADPQDQAMKEHIASIFDSHLYANMAWKQYMVFGKHIPTVSRNNLTLAMLEREAQ